MIIDCFIEIEKETKKNKKCFFFQIAQIEFGCLFLNYIIKLMLDTHEEICNSKVKHLLL